MRPKEEYKWLYEYYFDLCHLKERRKLKTGQEEEYYFEKPPKLNKESSAPGKYITLKKAVRCIETNAIYESNTVAQVKTDIDASSIGRCCNGIRESAGGYHWEYCKE
jgi:hypothetical protein